MLNYGLRMNQILNNPSVIVRCTDLGAFLETSTVEELKQYFQGVVDNIFGFPSHSGWGIRRLTRTTQPKETDAVVKLLAPDGPVFKAIYRLMTDRNYRLDYPISSLPPVLERRIARLEVPEFFTKKVHVVYDSYGQLAPLRNVTLNPFEYYFFVFTFASLGIGVSQNYLLGWGSLNDTAYTNLLEEYNNYFFPCDGQSVPPISAHEKPAAEATFHTNPVAQTPPRATTSSPGRLDSPHPTLFKASVFQETSSVPAAALEASFSAAPSSHLELWRSETVLSIIMEMWMSVDSNDTVSSIFVPSLPNVDLVKCVRMVVRHLHYFANCINQQALHPMEGVKRSLFPLYQRKLFSFLRHLFLRWPLDNTFRIVYETWLSYIQPWRYSKLDRFRQFRDKEIAQIEPLYYGFLMDNILFYTNLFHLLLPRYLRSDLTSFKNALMVFRASKVLTAQDNLKVVLCSIEKLVVRYICNLDDHQNVPFSCSGNVDLLNLNEQCTSGRLANIKQMISDLEPPGFVYKPLFSEETRKLVQSLIYSINHAIHALGETGVDSTPSPKATNPLMKFLGGNEAPWQSDRPDSPPGPFDSNRCMQLLQYSKQQLIFLFDLHEMDGVDTEQPSSWGDSLANGETLNNSDIHSEMYPGKFSPSIATSVISKGTLTPAMLAPKGNPDLVSVRQHELGALVAIFHTLSSNINRNFGGAISKMYFENTLRGKLSRAVFAPPELYSVIEKPAPGQQVRRQCYLPPRVNLRPFASMTYYIYLLPLLPLLRLTGYLSPLSVLVILLMLYLLKAIYHVIAEPRSSLQRLVRTYGPFADLPDNDIDAD